MILGFIIGWFMCNSWEQPRHSRRIIVQCSALDLLLISNKHPHGWQPKVDNHSSKSGLNHIPYFVDDDFLTFWVALLTCSVHKKRTTRTLACIIVGKWVALPPVKSRHRSAAAKPAQIISQEQTLNTYPSIIIPFSQMCN